jgi:hypothetical protein
MKIRHGGARALARASTILLLMLLWAGTAHAQFSGTIKGVVQDPSGAAVPKAIPRILFWLDGSRGRPWSAAALDHPPGRRSRGYPRS